MFSFEPLSADGICSILLLELFMQHGSFATRVHSLGLIRVSLGLMVLDLGSFRFFKGLV